MLSSASGQSETVRLEETGLKKRVHEWMTVLKSRSTHGLHGSFGRRWWGEMVIKCAELGRLLLKAKSGHSRRWAIIGRGTSCSVT